MTAILVVDDNAVTRKLVRFAFEQQGMRVLEAADGASGLRHFETEPVELVLQDLCLPDLDGFELVKRLRALPGGREVPILAFSGMLTMHDEARVSAAGFDDLISKPVEPSRLVQLVRAHLPGEAGPVAFGKGRRIVLADDDAVQRKLAAYKLEAAGFDVLLARNGREALALARRTPPAAVLSDVLMPGLDGFGLCTELRRDPRLSRVPVVLTTNSYVEHEDRVLALKAGAHALVHRTPDLKSVLLMLQEALERPTTLAQPATSAEVETGHKLRMMRQLERQVTLNVGINQRCALLSAEMAVLKGVSDALSSHGNTEEAVRRALAACFDAGGISLGALFLMENGRRVVSFGFSEGWEEQELATLWGEEALLDEVLVGGATVLLPGSHDEGRRLLERAGAESALLSPVGAHGVLLMMAKTSELESGDRLSFAEAVAAQISQALSLSDAFTQQENAERAAREQAALLRSILDSLGDGVVVADRHGEFIQWNAAASELVKMGPRGTGLFAPDRTTPLEHAQLPWVRALKGEVVDGVELFARPPGATRELWLSVSGRPWRDEHGRVRGGVAIFRDVTLEKNTQAQLMAADRMASMGLLAAGIAHEINNPLTAVIANLSLCRTELEESGASGLRELVGDAFEAAEQVRGIVRDVKVFSRKDDAPPGVVELNRVLDSSLRMAWNEIRHRAQLLKVYGPPASVRGNESRLVQVFLNLLVNAAQAIPEGQASSHNIRVSTRPAGDRWCVEISDTGAGMTKDTLEHLFTPFFTTKPAGEGTGLGLSICQRIVSGYGGEIEVESAPGEGTTFRVLLPQASPAQPLATRATQARRVVRRNVLLVDDEDLVARVVRRVLRPEHEVSVAKSVDAALELMGGGAVYDVILCDLVMPQKTGIELFREVASRYPGQERRIVFITGGAFTAALRGFLDTVPNARLEKPFELDRLRAVVDEAT